MTNVDVAEQLSHLPAQPVAALLVIRLVEDPETSPAELGRLVEMDPALSARVMRLANSAHSGGHGAVRSAARAVLQLGFSTVKGIAAAAATSLLADNVDLGPPEHWVHAVATAAGASIAADVLGVPPSESFSAGLLHDVGSLVLHRCDRALYTSVVERAAAHPGSGGLDDAEREAFGMTHAEAGADALEIWQFPASFVDAVRRHHDPVSSVRPLGQAVILGGAIAALVEPVELGEHHARLEPTLAELGMSPTLGRALVSRTKQELEGIVSFLESAR